MSRTKEMKKRTIEMKMPNTTKAKKKRIRADYTGGWRDKQKLPGN